jgi:hypothetical protein
MRKEQNEKKRQKQRGNELGEDSSEFKQIVSFFSSAIIHMTTQTALGVMRHQHVLQTHYLQLTDSISQEIPTFYGTEVSQGQDN